MIYVPNCVLTAICFPKAEVDNKFPHMTLFMHQNWEASVSNQILMSTCDDRDKFKNQYNRVKHSKAYAASVERIKTQILNPKTNLLVNVYAYFIIFPQDQ